MRERFNDTLPTFRNPKTIFIGVTVFICGFLVVLHSYIPTFLNALTLICFCLALAIIGAAVRFRRGRLFLVNLAAVIAAVGLVELYLTVWPPKKAFYQVTSKSSLAFVHDPNLGYTIKPGRHIYTDRILTPDGEIIYNVKYSIDRYGLRQTPVGPNASSEENKRAVFFVGGSFTFGAGVSDRESLPAQFSRLSQLRAINFGIPGQGASQALRELEIGRPRTIERRDPLAIVYTLLAASHMMRAAGRAEWDPNGPHYELVDGKLKYLGLYGGQGLPLWQKLLLHSRIYDALLDYKIRRIITRTDRQRFLAIVLRIRELSLNEYHAPFIVILWDAAPRLVDFGSHARWIHEKLEEAGIPVLLLSRVAPALQSSSYYFPDLHPTRKAYAMVAKALYVFVAQHFPNLTNNTAMQ